MMKGIITLLISLCLVGLLAVQCIPDDDIPMDCYNIEIRASSVDGIIEQIISDYSFIYDDGQLAKWKQDEGVRVMHDTLRHLVIIEVRQCVLPDRKLDRW